MSFSSIVNIFLPKQRIFYTIFEDVTTNLHEMAIFFRETLDETDHNKRNARLKTIDDFEHKNDSLTHDLFVELGRNFITPFDREDIHSLATVLDDVADYIWASAKRILNYHIDEVNPSTIEFADLIVKGTIHLKKAVLGLRNMKDIKSITDACVAINSIENEADVLLDTHTRILFETETNAIELIKQKDLMEDLEIVTDKCEDAANVIESIIIKYS